MAVHKKYNNGTKSNALGRGLDALISTEGVRTQGSSTINEIAIDQIEANPNQPRREFDEEALHELAESIKAIGIIQPITLRQVAENHFQIIAGERRWRASQLAGLTAIPAYIRTISDENVMEMALVENIQRQDLNAIEIALAYEHLLENEGMTQEKISERVGKSRAAIANYLRLLKLPAQVQMALQKKEIDMGHCRALLALDSPSLQIKLFKEIQKNGYSVRKVEEMVQHLKNGEDIEALQTRIQTMQADYSRQMAEIQQQHRREIADKEARHKQEISFLKTVIARAAAWFPYFREMLRIENLCRLVGFSDGQTATLVKGKPLEYAGELYSEEHGRKFKTEKAGVQVVKDPTDGTKLVLAIDRKPIAEWFKEQSDKLFTSIRKTVTSPRKNRGIGI